MAASRMRCGFSLCARLVRTRCLTSSRSLLLDTNRLAKPLTVLNTNDFVSVASRKLKTNQFSTSNVVSMIASNNSDVTEDPGSRPSSVGGGVSVTESEDDDDPFMSEQIKRYNRFRRWVATIMGENVETFTDKDVQEAIEYLMPSSLYAKDARPKLMHPYELYKKKRSQMFDNTGRPQAAAFYTGRVGYHDLIFDIYTQFDRLRKASTEYHVANENQESNKIGSDSKQTDNLQNESKDKQVERPIRWIKKIELENRLEETLEDREYEVVLHRLKKLAAHPKAHLVWDFLENFIFPVATPGIKQVALQLDEEGRAHGNGHRKRAIAEAWVKEGSGQVTINGRPLVQYFARIEDRQQILFPFHVVDGIGQYDAECNVIGGGPAGQAGAIRLALSRALLNFSVDFQDSLLEAGLLIRDSRKVERKKPGQKKARKKFAWVKR